MRFEKATCQNGLKNETRVPLMLGVASSLRRAGPAQVTNAMPHPSMTREPMYWPRLWEPAWNAAPTIVKNCPAAIPHLRPLCLSDKGSRVVGEPAHTIDP